jgi:hypothetical protein
LTTCGTASSQELCSVQLRLLLKTALSLRIIETVSEIRRSERKMFMLFIYLVNE